MKISLLCCIFLPVFSVSAWGQSPATAAQKTSPAGASKIGATAIGATAIAATAAPNSPPVGGKAGSSYAAEPIVVEHRDAVYAMKADGTGWRQTRMAVRVQSEAAVKQLGVLIVPYAGSSEHVEISYARIRRPDGTVVETPVSAAMDMPNPVTREAPFYSDLKQMELPIRSLAVGDTLEWQVKVVRTKAEAPGQFWGQENFSKDTVVLSESLELHVPKDEKVNVWSPANKPVETTSGGERVYRWESTQLKPTVGKEADAEKELKKKQIWTADQELDAKEGKLPNVAWTTFTNWQAVGAWYRALEDGRTDPDATVRAKVVELTANKATDEEKVRAVYGYVATQIRYIGVAFGAGRYQPHSAAEVLENQYGDCKDKHTLLAAMLEVLGLHPDAVLIGSGVRFNETVPSPASFNHLITRVSVNGKEVWLDSTAEVAPYDALEYQVRDKKALVIPQAGTASIERTPAALPFPSFTTMDAVGTLDKNGISNSRIVVTANGDGGMLIRAVLRQFSPSQYDKFAEGFSQAIGYGGTTSNVQIDNLADTSFPIRFSYDYKREKGGDWSNFRIIPQLEPVAFPTVNDDEPPVQSIELGVPRVETSSSAMKLPDGWTAELPKPIHAKSVYATYDETYRFEKGTVYATRKLEILKEKVPVADWKSYKKWADAADLNNEQYIQLTQPGQKSSAQNAGTAEDGTDAAGLIRSAYAAMQQHNLAKAKSLLDQAKKLNPNQRGLWGTYAYVAAFDGKAEESAEDLQKEAVLYPEEAPSLYQAISMIYSQLGQPKKAEDVLKTWMAADTGNPLAYQQMIHLQLVEGNAAEAVKTADAALANLPEDKKKDEGLQYAIGNAEIRAGMKTEGRAVLVALLKTAQAPGIMNNCAYELADARVELPLAESKSRAAIEKLESESKTRNLNADSEKDFQRWRAQSVLLSETWDTLGWVLFREGKLDEAKSYVKAAWMNRQDSAVAEHLGEIEEARGNKSAALTAYELALTAVSGNSGDEKIKLWARVDALKKAGTKPSGDTSQEALQNMRTFSLGPANGMLGSDQYWLILSGGTVGSAKVIGDEGLHGGMERLKKIKFTGYWPPDSTANLVRKGILFCGLNGCQLVLEP